VLVFDWCYGGGGGGLVVVWMAAVMFLFAIEVVF
jgi:hypothetical protein